MNNTVVYGLTNEYGQICYVGITDDINNRFIQHISMQKEFTVSGCVILEQAQARQSAKLLEREWIKFLRRENLFNKSDGGDGYDGMIASDGSRVRSEIVRGYIPRSLKMRMLRIKQVDPWMTESVQMLRALEINTEKLERKLKQTKGGH